MNKLLDDCIVACENCVVGCLKMKNTSCISDCIVCEKICKTLKLAIKCNMKPELLNSLKHSCEIACNDCSSKCKDNKMVCCNDCIIKCERLYSMLSKNNTKIKTKAKAKAKAIPKQFNSSASRRSSIMSGRGVCHPSYHIQFDVELGLSSN